MLTKHDVIHGAGWQGQNDINWGQTSRTSMPPDQKVSKAEYITNISINIDYTKLERLAKDKHSSLFGLKMKYMTWASTIKPL
jgi:hypothetical protein